MREGEGGEGGGGAEGTDSATFNARSDFSNGGVNVLAFMLDSKS